MHILRGPETGKMDSRNKSGSNNLFITQSCLYLRTLFGHNFDEKVNYFVRHTFLDLNNGAPEKVMHLVLFSGIINCVFHLFLIYSIFLVVKEKN